MSKFCSMKNPNYRNNNEIVKTVLCFMNVITDKTK